MGMMMMMGNKVKVGDLLELTTWSSRATTAITATAAKTISSATTKMTCLLRPLLPLLLLLPCYCFCCPPVFATITFLQQPATLILVSGRTLKTMVALMIHILDEATHLEARWKWVLLELERRVCAKRHHKLSHVACVKILVIFHGKLYFLCQFWW